MTPPAASPTLEDIRAAAQRLGPFVYRTPVLSSRGLDELSGTRTFFKCESFQRTGSFKIRGATNAVRLLSDEQAARGVVTHSSGNHAAALACAARDRGIPARLVVPRDAPRTKLEAAEGFGGQIHLCEPGMAARESLMAQIQKQTGAVPVPPYDDSRVIAGQGTAAFELLEQTGALDAIAAPVSGGGLLSGTAIAARSLRPGLAIFGVEPEQADDAHRSFRSGRLEPPGTGNTIADGLRATLCPRTLAIIQSHVTDILTVSEEAIVEAMRLLWRYLKVVVEPSGAVPFAMLLAHRERFAGQRVGLLLSGGNLDLDRLPWRHG